PDAEAWDGISVEQAYDRLPEPEPDTGPPGDDGNPSPGGDAGGAGPGADDDSPEDGDGDGSDANGPSDPAKADANHEPDDSGEDGGCDTPPSHDPAGTGEVMDAPAGTADGDDGQSGPSASGIAAEEQAWDEAMHQAASLAKAEGRLPGAIEETVRGAHASTLDWRTLLRRHMTDAAKRDYSWSVPNRRFIDTGLYLPSIRSEGIDTIAVIVDTSGSLDPDTLADFWSEVRDIATEIEPERVLLLQVDTAVRDTAEFAAGDLPEDIIVRGRGGTDFRPGFAWLDENGITPGVCLYFTDMECSRYPETEPLFAVTWVNHGDPPGDWNREPWGERIDIAPS
ncbi:MAG: VWA-like domain-containing protein, partial [Rhodospirillales bacterium]|nr:VWA-like domain-containing protein [Rhodospirillales bacterium]